MMNSRLLHTAILCALILSTVLSVGCTSFKGTTDKWSTAWKEKSKPKPVDPNHEEVVTYWGQKKKPANSGALPAELKEKLAKNTADSQRSKEYVDNFKTGNQKLAENRLDEARRAYEQALTARPDDADVHHRLAVVADKQKMFGLADDHYEAAMRQRPRDPNLLSDLGYSYSLRGNDPQAEKTLQQALSINPAHKGAMANLGTLYSRQGRYDEAMAIFRRGSTEADAQRYMAQLFPQGRPTELALAAATSSGAGLTQEQQVAENQRQAPPMPADIPADLSQMNMEQLKAEMERRRLQSIQARQQQQMAEMNPVREAPVDSMPTNQPWTSGTNAIRSNTVSQNGIQISPSSAAVLSQSAALSQYQGPPSSAQSHAGFQAPLNTQGNSGPSNAVPNGVAMAPAGNWPMAPPGTNPLTNMEPWQGAPVQVTPQQQSFGPSSSGAINDYGANPNGQTQQPTIAQAGFVNGSSASQRAAQLGMSAGPGGLFPIVAGQGNTNGYSAPSSTPAFSNRMGTELTQPPRYPSPQFVPPQHQPSMNQFGPGNGFAPNGGMQNFPNVNPTTSNRQEQSGWNGKESLAPVSPANLGQAWDTQSNTSAWGTGGGSGVVQAGGSTDWGQSPTRSGDGFDSFQSEMTSETRSRYAKAPWSDSAAMPTGSSPYNGAWPNSNAQSPSAPSNGQATTSSLPMWNGGNAVAPASSNNPANNTPPQWPYSPQR